MSKGPVKYHGLEEPKQTKTTGGIDVGLDR